MFNLNEEKSDEMLLDAALKNKQDFKEYLKNAISTLDKRNHTRHKNVDIYRRAFISKSLFSKVFNSGVAKKDTVIMLAFGLEATLQEAEELLKQAGYSLSDCSGRDVIFTCCFKNRITDLTKVNALLKRANERPLLKDKK